MIWQPTRVLAALLSIMVLFVCGLMFCAQTNGEAGLTVGGADVFTLETAAGYDRVADQLLLNGRDPATLREARKASRAALILAPYDTGALLRLAYIDRIEDGRLGQQGLKALATSYERVAFDPAVARWRIQFALENWQALPLELRLRVQNEVFALATEPGHRWPLRAQLRRVEDPYGTVVAAFWSARVGLLQETASARRASASIAHNKD